jgi:uncharacterized protein YcbX
MKNTRYKVSELHTYPIKSMAGIRSKEIALTPFGFAYDRYWMLVDESNTAITQRQIPQLALFKVGLLDNGVMVHYDGDSIHIPYQTHDGQATILTSLFDNTIESFVVNNKINQWFSHHLKQEVRLVQQMLNNPRTVKNHPDTTLHYADGGQFLILGKPAFNHLNDKLATSLPINRFRPNIVFEGGQPHDEDQWQRINIGNIPFEITKSCGRCQITTVNQENGEQGKEPLVTLSKYRLRDRQIYFGRYLKLLNSFSGKLVVGDEITVLR